MIVISNHNRIFKKPIRFLVGKFTQKTPEKLRSLISTNTHTNMLSGLSEHIWWQGRHDRSAQSLIARRVTAFHLTSGQGPTEGTIGCVRYRVPPFNDFPDPDRRSIHCAAQTLRAMVRLPDNRGDRPDIRTPDSPPEGSYRFISKSSMQAGGKNFPAKHQQTVLLVNSSRSFAVATSARAA